MMTTHKKKMSSAWHRTINNHAALACFLVVCTCIQASEIRLMSTDAAGIPLRHGAGWLNGRPIQAPVGDNGHTAFVAPMPDYDNSPATQFHASYLRSADELHTLYPGVDPMSVLLGTPLRTTNVELATDAAMSTAAIVCDERVGSTSATTVAQLHVWASTPPTLVSTQQLGNSTDVQAVYCHVAVAAAGQHLLVYGRNRATTLYQINGNTIAPLNDLSTAIPYNGERIALSGDGQKIFFASDIGDNGLLPGQNGIFCYQVPNASLVFICAAGTKSLEPEISVSADGNTVVFRRRSGTLAIAHYQNSNWTCPDDFPIQAAVCRNPTVNADGRFIAYQAMQTDTDIFQVYRYDCLRNISELASANTTGQPANDNCQYPAISPDGKLVTFVSPANNLAGETNGLHHVFRKQLNTPIISEDWMLLSLQQGWNLVSVPFVMNQDSIERLRNCGSNIIWTWDVAMARYALLKQDVTAGKGFWIYLNENRTVSISGHATGETVALTTKGWHLLGPATTSTEPSLPFAEDNPPRVIFGLNMAKQSYIKHATSAIDLGHAYWVFATGCR